VGGNNGVVEKTGGAIRHSEFETAAPSLIMGRRPIKVAASDLMKIVTYIAAF
jgi:hypothetical protein